MPNPHPDDIILWPDGVWCNRSDCNGFEPHTAMSRSDDYEVLFADTNRWFEFLRRTEDESPAEELDYDYCEFIDMP